MRIQRWFLPIFFGICAIGSYAASVLATKFGNAGSDLQAVYVQGFSKTFATTALFFAFCTAVSLAYALIPSLRHAAERAWEYIENYFEASTFRYALLAFGSAAAFLFALNAPGILNGTFLIDDYGMYAIAMQKTPLGLIWTPINDHVIPLFWLELKTIFSVVGTNAPSLNFPLYGAATIAVGAAAILLRQLGFGIKALIAFLAIFASTTVVSHQMYGFYAVAPYFQVLAVFSLSLVCFMQSRTHVRYSGLFLTASILLTIVAIFLESGGIWTPLALAIFAVAYRIGAQQSVLKEKVVILSAFFITIAYVAYLVAIPHFSDAQFYGPTHLPISLSTVYELYKVLTAGVLSSFFIPRMGLVMSQPRFEGVEIVWHVGMLILFAAAALITWWAGLRGTIRTRVWGLYFLLLTLGTALLVAIARPSSHAVSFYRDQNLLFPLFFISLMFVIAGCEWISSAQGRARSLRSATVIAVCVLIFGSQMVFAFYKDQYMGDIAFNHSLIERLHQTVVPALNELSAVHTPVTVPALGGMFLGASNYQLPDLSAFSFFLGIKNVQWVAPGKNAATSSVLFADALQHDQRLRTWYLAPGEIAETCTTTVSGTDTKQLASGKPVLVARAVDTTKQNKLAFSVTAEDAPEKIFISIAFENQFNATGSLAVIRLDQYTLKAQGDVRRYACVVNLNDIPAYALSGTVKNLSLTTETPGTYMVSAQLLQNGGTLPSGTQRN